MDIRKPNPAKAAGILRAFLKTQGIELKHTAALEAVARVAGYSNWQAMAADPKARQHEAPALLRQDSACEYTFVGPPQERVWITLGNVSAYLGANEEGVVVDLFAKSDEDSASSASAFLSFNEARDAVLARHVLSYEEVAEWVGLHYRKNFDTESPTAQLDWIERYREAHPAEVDEGACARFVYGTWTHLFGVGLPEATVRFVFDRLSNSIVRMDILSAGKWLAATSDQLQDVQDSLVNANDDALERPPTGAWSPRTRCLHGRKSLRRPETP